MDTWGVINILCFDLLRAGGGLILGAHQNLGLGGEGGWGSGQYQSFLMNVFAVTLE